MAMTKILSDFVWWSQQNFQGTQTYGDSIDQCLDIEHFKKFAWPVVYNHNSRGYRDSEWPDTMEELQQSIWCFGDSFTVGNGSPREHTWTFLLQQCLQRRCINISLNGASNNWMVRKIKDLLTQVIPDTIIVHWSYTHRKELVDFDLPNTVNAYWKEFYKKVQAPDWPNNVDLKDFHTLVPHIQQEIKQVHYAPGVDRFDFDTMLEGAYDEDRQIYHSRDNEQQDTDNTIRCVNETEQLAKQHGIKLIHSFIPRFAPENQVDIIMQHMKESGTVFVPVFSQLDLARDGHHYDIKTAQYFVSKIIQKM
jgi:hypothetical protein